MRKTFLETWERIECNIKNKYSERAKKEFSFFDDRIERLNCLGDLKVIKKEHAEAVFNTAWKIKDYIYNIKVSDNIEVFKYGKRFN